MKAASYSLRCKSILILCSSMLCLCLFLSGCRANPNLALTVGSQPPALQVTYPDGHVGSLSDFHGSVVLLNFWASWCGPCVEELPALEKLYQALKARGFVVVGVGIDDDAERLKTFAANAGVTFPILIDRGNAKADFKLTGVPETILLGRDGSIMLMLDPETGQASPKILGPRNWAAPVMSERIGALLAR